MPADIEIVPSELAQIVESVFENMIGLEAHTCRAAWFAGEDRLAAAVRLEGAWNGALLVECGGQQAREFTQHFLSASIPAGEDVVQDMLGELANMIAGNLKCVLGRGIQLSMPVVVGSEYSPQGAEIRERLNFETAEGPFRVTVLALLAERV